MSQFHGNLARVTLAASYRPFTGTGSINFADDWTMRIAVVEIDVTPFNLTLNLDQILTGTGRISGSLTGFMDNAETFTLAPFTSMNTAAALLQLYALQAPSIGIQFNVRLSNFSTGASRNAPVKWSIDYTHTGDATPTII